MSGARTTNLNFMAQNKQYIDQMGRSIALEGHPQRIVSLVPSQSELLHYLGLNTELVGVTKFCVRPAELLATTTKIGGTKKVKHEVIERLAPDLIIGNKEENQQEDIERLAEHYPVWMSDVKTLDDALEMIESIGQLVNRAEAAKQLATDIAAAFGQLASAKKRRAAYFIWRKPYMVAAGDTFINELLDKAGYENVYAGKERYPQTTLEELATLAPEVILLSSEPFPFAEKHFDEIRRHIPTAKIHVVDGELFSWYGNRLLFAPNYFRALNEYW